MLAPRLLLVQPSLHAYRVPFLNLVGARIDDLGGLFRVSNSAASPAMYARGDSSNCDYAVAVPTRWISIRGHQVALRSLTPVIDQISPNLIVIEQALHNLETYPLFLQARKVKAEIGMWGHGRSYSTPQSLSLIHI